MEERDPLTGEIIGAAIEVHRELGPGLLESVYQLCLEHELRLRGIDHKPQELLPIVYKGLELDVDLRMDLFFPERLVIELKSRRETAPDPRSSAAHLPPALQGASRLAHQFLRLHP